VKTGNTLLSREVKLHAFLSDVAAFSDTTKTFLDNNGSNIVRLGQLSEPQLQLLNRYSPEFPCLLRGLVDQAPNLASTFRGFVFHIDLITLPRQPRGYTKDDVPVLGADNGPACVGLPTPQVPLRNVPNLNDGVDGLKRGDAQRTAPQVDASLTSAAAGAGQKAFFNSLTAPVLGMPADEVPDLTTLLFGPLATGTEVSVR
jgi:phospholipid/cholesterol/gamma-HCH transport system substrate-binding protein